MTPEETVAEALELADTSRALADAIASVLPAGHGVIFLVVPRRSQVSTFVAASIPSLPQTSLASSLGQIVAAMGDGSAISFSELHKVGSTSETKH